MKQIAKTLAILCGITCATALVPAFAASPAAVDYDKLIVQMERAPIDFVVDGTARNGSTIQVKNGNIVEVQFAQFYNGEKVWWFAGITSAPDDFFLLQNFEGPPVVNGFVQLQSPGTMTFKFRASTGTHKLVFKRGSRAQSPEDQKNQLADETVEITLEVQ